MPLRNLLPSALWFSGYEPVSSRRAQPGLSIREPVASGTFRTGACIPKLFDTASDTENELPDKETGKLVKIGELTAVLHPVAELVWRRLGHHFSSQSSPDLLPDSFKYS